MLLQNTGVTLNLNGTTDGYILIHPIAGDQVYLIDYSGAAAHSWKVGTGFTNWAYLLPNGNLFVNERCDNPQGVSLTGSGLMREYDWRGNIVWEHLDPWQHHDARRLANGNAVYLAFAPLSVTDKNKIKGGIKNSESDAGIVGECVREVDPGGEVVWEWNFNSLPDDLFPIHPNANRWSRSHTNTVYPLPDGNYLISCKILNLIFILSRQTGEMIWHYQNDLMGGQHDAQLLDNGNILLFANGAYAADLHYSQVWELDPETCEIVWSYKARDNPQSFFSPHIGGCQRLTSGNTLVCEGSKGCIFEVTPSGDVVWEYVCPYTNPTEHFGKVNWLFRARHYLQDAIELSDRL